MPCQEILDGGRHKGHSRKLYEFTRTNRNAYENCRFQLQPPKKTGGFSTIFQPLLCLYRP